MTDRDRGPRTDSNASTAKTDKIILDIQNKLSNTTQPVNIPGLNAFERKCIHAFFDNNSDYRTKTYRNGENYIFRVYPIGNLKELVEKEVQRALKSGKTTVLPPMTSFERFIVHEYMQSKENIETVSVGEDKDRHIELTPKSFGRKFKSIIKKIKFL
ncbi:hypothetical protein KAH55_13485 [bacterium]|nr:hypothetical protein [bacterium]